MHRSPPPVLLVVPVHISAECALLGFFFFSTYGLCGRCQGLFIRIRTVSFPKIYLIQTEGGASTKAISLSRGKPLVEGPARLVRHIKVRGSRGRDVGGWRPSQSRYRLGGPSRGDAAHPRVPTCGGRVLRHVASALLQKRALLQKKFSEPCARLVLDFLPYRASLKLVVCHNPSRQFRRRNRGRRTETSRGPKSRETGRIAQTREKGRTPSGVLSGGQGGKGCVHSLILTQKQDISFPSVSVVGSIVCCLCTVKKDYFCVVTVYREEPPFEMAETVQCSAFHKLCPYIFFVSSVS